MVVTCKSSMCVIFQYLKPLGKKLKHNETYIDEIDAKTCCSMSTCCILLCFLAGATFGWQCVCDGVWDGNQWTFLTFCTSFNGPFDTLWQTMLLGKFWKRELGWA